MLAAQGGLCAICREAPATHVDHDHATGKVRGLLCFNCNGALGQFRDRQDLMLRAVVYLGGPDFTDVVRLDTDEFVPREDHTIAAEDVIGYFEEVA